MTETKTKLQQTDTENKLFITSDIDKYNN